MILRSITTTIALLVVVVNCVNAKTKRFQEDSTLEEEAHYRFKQLKDILLELNVFKNNDFARIQAILTGGSRDKTDTDLAKTILRSMMPTCHSFHNQGNVNVTNVIFNNSNVSFHGTIPNLNSKGIIHGGKDSKEENENEKGDDEDETNPKKENENTSKGPHVLPMSPFSTSSKYPWLANNSNNVRPLYVRAKLEGDQVRLTFNVSHTQPAVVQRIWTFDGEVKFLKGPEEYGLEPGELLSSIVEFTYNASVCLENDEPYSYSQYKKEHFLFATRENVFETAMTVDIPSCIFSFDNKNNKTELSQDFFYPDFWEKVNVSDIKSTLRENATFKIEVQVSTNNEIQLTGIMYDPSSNLMNDTNFLRFNGENEGDNITVDTHNSENSINTTKIEFVNVKRINGTLPGLKPIVILDDSPEQEDPYYMSATAMFSISLPNDKSSVILRLADRYSFKKEVDDGINFSVILYLRTNFSYKSPNTENAFPEGKFRIDSPKKFSCGGESDYNYNFGPNQCIIICAVQGRGVKKIRLRKLKGGIDPIKTFTDINSHFSYKFVSLGSPTKEVDGIYECKVVPRKGKSLRWKVKVTSWGLPVVQGDVSVSDDVVTYTCSANTTRRPLEIEVFAEKEYEIEGSLRLDNDTRVTKKISQKDEVKNMTLQIPSEMIKYPIRYISCRVTNRAGETDQQQYIYSDDIPGYYVGSDHPHFIKNESTITENMNGTTTIICKAHGKKPLEMGFHLDYWLGDTDIKEDNQTYRTDTVQGDTSISRLTIPTERLYWPKSWLYCTAKNTEGSSYYEFHISDHIETRHG